MWILGLFAGILVLILFLPLSVDKKQTDGFVVKIDYGNGVEKNFSGSPKINKTAWDTLQQASAHSFLSVDVADGFYPSAIDQRENGEGGKHWILYVNKKRTFASPIEVKINSGDDILWKFE